MQDTPDRSPPCPALPCAPPFPQTVRNQVLAVSILAAVTAPLAATLIQVMTDPAKMGQARRCRCPPPPSKPACAGALSHL